ncbi:MAG: nitroreductase family protein [Planctomycetes bacterium]|nr:nitroreductase family protein [Planctomycetota bacterium]
MLECIKKILEYAIWAPSGDNSQPWSFKIDGNKLLIYNLPDRDNPYLNFNQSGSLIAHGGLIENIVIATPHFGYKTEISLHHSNNDNNLIASISFVEDAKQKLDPLFFFIKQRHTNRRPYEEKPLTVQQQESLLTTPTELNFGSLKLIEDINKKKILGRAGALAEIVILENKILHEYLFRDIVWTEVEEKKVRHGLYVDTMEFNPIQKSIFRFARKWYFMKFAVGLGLPKFIAKEDSKLYASAAAIGIIAMRGRSHEDFLNAGRLMQRLWLKTTSLGLVLQPVVATLFFAQRILSGKTENLLSSQHIDLMRTAYDEIKKISNITDETIAMMFRIGTAKPASTRSSRIAVAEKIISDN